MALLCNQASTDRYFRHSRDLINTAFPGQLTCLFTPQHGFFAEKQDNMIESDHIVDRATGLPVFSLYGEVRKPTPAMYEHFDVLLVDIVDVGTRVYTFLYTLAYCLEAARECGKQVVVLDRPNPVGGELIEGNLLDEDCRSFVGLFPIPMRHGLTFGELALMINQEYGIGADLEIVAMEGWQRRMLFPDTGLPWVFPSPNMPTFAASLVYPGQVIFEGTNISEGRGTTLPFELLGAPYVDCSAVLDFLRPIPLPGCFLRPLIFEPTSNKWAGQPCHGFQLHVTDPAAFRPYRASLALLQAFMRCHPDQFGLKPPPYEYEFERTPLDLILGSSSLRHRLAEGADLMSLEDGWLEGLAGFGEMRQGYFLYR
ncbi:MAG: exo-beta-N-acetylmuramidase NamZ family protein [Thermodesulfobacteriota bacterium]